MQKLSFYVPRGRSLKKSIFLLFSTCVILCFVSGASALNTAAADFSIPLPDDWETLDRGFWISPPEHSTDSGFAIQYRQETDEIMTVPIDP